MKRLLGIVLLFLAAGGLMGQATPTATPTPTGPPMCAITGNVANPDGSPYVGVIKFDSSIVQIINNIPINPMQVSANTTPTGVIQPISLPQGLFTKVTMCPSASAASGCAATFTVIVPAAPTANFGGMAMGTNLVNPSIVTTNLSVSGTTSLASTTINGPLSVSGATTIGALPLSIGSATQIADLSGTGQNGTASITTSSPGIPIFQLAQHDPGSGGFLGQIISGSLGTSATDKRGAGIAFYDNGHNNAAKPYGAVLFYTANGAPIVLNMELFEDGGLAVTPTMNPSADKGPGTLNISGNYYINGNQITTNNLADTKRAVPWTPQLQFGGATTGIVYQSGWPYGYYYRVGPLVYVVWGIWLASKGTATGAATMCGLPFHVPNDGGNFGPWGLLNYGTLSAGTPWLPVLFTGGNGGNCVTFGWEDLTNTGAGKISTLSQANFTGADNIQGSFSYPTDDP